MGEGIELEKLIEYGSKEAIIQNLKDAGCCEDTVACCIDCLDCGKKAELLKRLEHHRKDLLQEVHKAKFMSEKEVCPEEKQIDCLDYLVYQINRCRGDKET